MPIAFCTSITALLPRFAMVEIKIAMVKLLRRFRLETDETTRLELLNGDMFMYSFSGINLRLVMRDTD